MAEIRIFIGYVMKFKRVDTKVVNIVCLIIRCSCGKQRCNCICQELLAEMEMEGHACPSVIS